MEITMKAIPLLTLHKFIIRHFSIKPSVLWLAGLYMFVFGATTVTASESNAGVLSILPWGVLTSDLVGSAIMAGCVPLLVARDKAWQIWGALGYVPYLISAIFFSIETGSVQAAQVHLFAQIMLIFTVLSVHERRHYRGY